MDDVIDIINELKEEYKEFKRHVSRRSPRYAYDSEWAQGALDALDKLLLKLKECLNSDK